MVFGFMDVFHGITHNVSPLRAVANESEPSFLCQDKTFFVKIDFRLRKTSQLREAVVTCQAGKVLI